MKICCTGDQKFTDAYLRFSLDLWEKNIVSSLPEKLSEDVNLSLCLECFCLRLSARGIGGGEGGGIEEGGRSSAAKTP